MRTMVLGKLGVTNPTSADADIVYEAMDLRLKEMHRLGIFWRKVVKVPLNFSVDLGVNSASATSDILFPIKLTVKDGSDDEPVDIVGIREWAAIQNKTESGFPTKALWKGSAEFLFHPVPTANSTAKLTYEKFADDTTAGAVFDVDVSMLRAFRDILAYDVADTFGVPEQKMPRLMKDSDRAEINIRRLAVQRVDNSTVSVDDWGKGENEETDYGR